MEGEHFSPYRADGKLVSLGFQVGGGLERRG
jgi:hypothetical protein